MYRTIVLLAVAALLASCAPEKETPSTRAADADRHDLEIARKWAPPNATNIVAHGEDWEEFDVEVAGVGKVHVLASTCDGKLDWQAFGPEAPRP